MKLSELKSGDVLELRRGKPGESGVDWGLWKKAEIFLTRRERQRPIGVRNPNIGDILEIMVIGDANGAEFRQDDFCPDLGYFEHEGETLEIRGLIP